MIPTMFELNIWEMGFRYQMFQTICLPPPWITKARQRLSTPVVPTLRKKELQLQKL